MAFNIGENGYLGVSYNEATWGTTGTSAVVALTKVLSSSLQVQKERRSSSALEGGRGTRSSVQTLTTRSGSVSLEVTPDAGIGELFRASLGDYNGSGTATVGGWTAEIDGDIAAGVTTIPIKTIVGTPQDGDTFQIGVTASAGTEVVTISDASAVSSIITVGATINAHSDDDIVVETNNALTYDHNFIRTDNVELPSVTLFESLGGNFGINFKGTRVNSMALSFSQGENVTADFDMISKDYDKVLAANLLTASQKTTLRTTNDPFIFEKGCLKDSVGGTSIGGVKSGSITVNNNLQENSYLCDNGDLSSLIGLRSEVTVTLDIDWQDSTYFDNLVGDTSLELALTFTHSNSDYQLQIHIPQLALSEAPHNLESGILSTSISGTAEVDSVEGYDIKVSLQDNTYSYLSE